MTDLTCVIDRDLPVSTVLVAGTLDHTTAPRLRAAVLKVVTDQPELVLIDVRGLRHAMDLSLTAFPALLRHAAAVGVSVMLVAPSPALVRQLELMAVARHVPTYATRDAALAAHAARPGPHRVELHLSPVPAATAAARELVAGACRQWRLRHLTTDAELIVTELVANVVQHARTRMTVLVALRRHLLHLSVRDGSTVPPRLAGGDAGRGLLVVAGIASGWGHLETREGKVVWATLRLHRRTLP